MTKLNFGDCTLTKLDKLFGLDEVLESKALTAWIDQDITITDFEEKVLKQLQTQLIMNIKHWNEAELLQHVIAPMFFLVDFSSTKQFSFFAERRFGGMVEDIMLSGDPDGMIASGFREPEKPYFCFQEYKKEKDPDGDPAGQCLAPMLVAQEINEHSNWFFMTLQGKEYCISNGYMATRDDIFDIFRILKTLKQIVIRLVAMDE